MGNQLGLREARANSHGGCNGLCSLQGDFRGPGETYPCFPLQHIFHAGRREKQSLKWVKPSKGSAEAPSPRGALLLSALPLGCSLQVLPRLCHAWRPGAVKSGRCQEKPRREPRRHFQLAALVATTALGCTYGSLRCDLQGLMVRERKPHRLSRGRTRLPTKGRALLLPCTEPEQSLLEGARPRTSGALELRIRIVNWDSLDFRASSLRCPIYSMLPWPALQGGFF